MTEQPKPKQPVWTANAFSAKGQDVYAADAADKLARASKFLINLRK